MRPVALVHRERFELGPVGQNRLGVVGWRALPYPGGCLGRVVHLLVHAVAAAPGKDALTHEPAQVFTRQLAIPFGNRSQRFGQGFVKRAPLPWVEIDQDPVRRAHCGRLRRGAGQWPDLHQVPAVLAVDGVDRIINGDVHHRQIAGRHRRGCLLLANGVQRQVVPTHDRVRLLTAALHLARGCVGSGVIGPGQAQRSNENHCCQKVAMHGASS